MQYTTRTPYNKRTSRALYTQRPVYMQTMHLYGTVVGVCDWVLLMAPILSAERCHAQRCDEHLKIWNALVVIKDPFFAVGILIGLVALRTFVDIAYARLALDQTDFRGHIATDVRGHIALALASNYRVWVLMYILAVHLLVSYDALKVCVYTAPLCFTCIEGAMQLLSYCAMEDKLI